jgi:YfiH family protein
MDPLTPDWPAPGRVKALVTTRGQGNMGAEGRAGIARLLPSEPVWLRQVHRTTVIDADLRPRMPDADASIARKPGTVCAVMLADCMPVLFADDKGSVIGAAHAGWRGLSSGVIEATVAAMGVAPSTITAWLGPAIGPKVYEVGAEVREAFLDRDASAETAFKANRPGHWLLDLYAVARQRLRTIGVREVHGGAFCTYSNPDRFFSFRRDRTSERMAALIWLT